MLKGITKSGFRFEINEGLLDDYELLEMISKIDEHPIRIVNIIEKVLGEKQKNNLIKHLKSKYGKVTITEINKTLEEIFKANKKTKN